MAKGADGQADGATIVGREIVAAGSMINTLHPTVATGLGLIIDGIDGTLADALVTHGAEVAHPEMLIFFALRFQCRQIGDIRVDGVDAQPRAFARCNQQPMITNRAQAGQLRQVDIVGEAAQRRAGIGGKALSAQVVGQLVGNGRQIFVPFHNFVHTVKAGRTFDWRLVHFHSKDDGVLIGDAFVAKDGVILEAALSVMVQQGYAGATTRQIAAAAGINEVTLFRRFGSKKNLLLAAVEQEAAAFIEAGIEYSGDVEADLLRVVQFYQSLVQQRGPLIAMLLTEIPRQPDLLEIMQTPLKIIQKITQIIAQYQQAGILTQEPPLQAFLALVGPLFLREAARVIQPDLAHHSFDPADHVRRYLQGRAWRSGRG